MAAAGIDYPVRTHYDAKVSISGDSKSEQAIHLEEGWIEVSEIQKSDQK